VAVKVLQPAAAPTSHVDGAQGDRVRDLRTKFLQDGIEDKFVSATIPEVFTLHSQEHIKTALIVLIIPVENRLLRNEYTPVLAERIFAL
jgi:hypothetical protein